METRETRETGRMPRRNALRSVEMLKACFTWHRRYSARCEHGGIHLGEVCATSAHSLSLHARATTTSRHNLRAGSGVHDAGIHAGSRSTPSQVKNLHKAANLPTA
ncbi:hypothetical protein ElyMa_000416900 [Elysia marginata]|uniref:Uncharacterized protein n=1 Tax=Elysia marginata TaxID=1093978 RepID=A0AAV4FLH9_9GAST|nr:hypothetical protein ElyMa_000416900 [Elysia marginata]